MKMTKAQFIEKYKPYLIAIRKKREALDCPDLGVAASMFVVYCVNQHGRTFEELSKLYDGFTEDRVYSWDGAEKLTAEEIDAIYTDIIYLLLNHQMAVFADNNPDFLVKYHKIRTGSIG
jgi:hypothetical protein